VTGVAPKEAAAMEYVVSGGAETLSREQFDDFYNRTAPALRAYIRRVSGSAAAADDLLQEAYMRLLNAPPLNAPPLTAQQRKS
jgi:DNA-directed RNA polymerase specialized sigma24 family protein